MGKNIVLIGLMGSGKSTIGNLLAQKIGYKFIDTDHLIEKEANKTINEIFEKYGEVLFRKLESHVIQEVCKLDDKVISTGGGVVENMENIEKLKKNGVLFYLKATPDELCKRLKGMENRPLLRVSNPKNVLKQLLERREKFYKQADFEILTSNKQSFSIVDEIIEIYKQNEQE